MGSGLAVPKVQAAALASAGPWGVVTEAVQGCAGPCWGHCAHFPSAHLPPTDTL